MSDATVVRHGEVPSRFTGNSQKIPKIGFYGVGRGQTPRNFPEERSERTRRISYETQGHITRGGNYRINVALGGIVDEQGLADAVNNGVIAGAAIDVFTKEPTTENPLFNVDGIVVTPHLGASTTEAQDRAGLDIADQINLALAGDFVPYAVNISAADANETLKPFLPLAERLGELFSAAAGDVSSGSSIRQGSSGSSNPAAAAAAAAAWGGGSAAPPAGMTPVREKKVIREDRNACSVRNVHYDMYMHHTCTILCDALHST